MYIGFVAEKGRVYSQIHKYSYRKMLKIQVEHWNRMIVRMKESKWSDEDENAIRDFINFLINEEKIGKFYNVESAKKTDYKKRVDSMYKINIHEKQEKIIINFMECLVKELIELLKPRFMVGKNQIHITIRALHNLPKYFLYGSKTFVHLNETVADFHDIIMDAIHNMDESTKLRYLNKYYEMMDMSDHLDQK